MGTIRYYSQLCNNVRVVQHPVKEAKVAIPEGKPILRDTKEITLAEYDVDTKNAITAHRIKDYRRRIYNLVLLPRVNILFDKVLEGSVYWNELLQTKSEYG